MRNFEVPVDKQISSDATIEAVLTSVEFHNAQNNRLVDHKVQTGGSLTRNASLRGLYLDTANIRNGSGIVLCYSYGSRVGAPSPSASHEPLDSD